MQNYPRRDWKDLARRNPDVSLGKLPCRRRCLWSVLFSAWFAANVEHCCRGNGYIELCLPAAPAAARFRSWALARTHWWLIDWLIYLFIYCSLKSVERFGCSCWSKESISQCRNFLLFVGRKSFKDLKKTKRLWISPLLKIQMQSIKVQHKCENCGPGTICGPFWFPSAQLGEMVRKFSDGCVFSTFTEFFR